MRARSGAVVGRTSVVFVLLALGFAWLDWLAVVLSRAHVLPFSMESGGWFRASVAGSILSGVLRDFGPALAGVLALAMTRGPGAVTELGRRLIRWRLPAWLYLAGLFSAVGNLGVIVAGYAAGDLRLAPSPPSAAKLVLLFFLMALLDGPFGEEIGWRGVLLPELLRRTGAFSAALAVGAVWYLWHVPLYLADGKLPGPRAHALFALECLLLSAILTWFFLRSQGSVLLAIYLHNASNYFIVLRHKLFVATGDSSLASIVLVAWLGLVGGAALVSLWRSGRVDVESLLAA